MTTKLKKIISILLAIVFVFFLTTSTSAETDQEKLQRLNDQISQYQQELDRLSTQANTLSNLIAQYNTQIKLTQLKISQTEEKILLLGGRIDQLKSSLDELNIAYKQRVTKTYMMSRFTENYMLLLSIPNLTDAINTFNYLKRLQASDIDLLNRLKEAQDLYQTEKSGQEALQKDLESQKIALNFQKNAKNQLLDQTHNDEKKYQQLLSEAKAQLAALSSYAKSVGVTLIPHQDISDDWGKYYNQRDSDWGNIVINSQTNGCDGPCTLASVGCLVTSYSMVVTHYGGSVKPSDIALNSSNFSVGTALFNSPGPSANGHSATALENPSMQQLRDALSSGKSVIVGLSVNGGPYPKHYSDHWVVLRSVDGDSFKINDPLYAGAMNVSLKDHYSGWTIIQARIYN